jgi:hypothetical protein
VITRKEEVAMNGKIGSGNVTNVCCFSMGSGNVKGQNHWMGKWVCEKLQQEEIEEGLNGLCGWDTIASYDLTL